MMYSKSLERKIREMEYQEQFPYAPQKSHTLAIFITIIIVLAVFIGGWIIQDHLAQRSNPPVACQLLGGQWTIVTGWRCNSL